MRQFWENLFINPSIKVANPNNLGPKWLRVLLWIASISGFWLVVGVGGIAVAYLFIQASLPVVHDLHEYNPPLTTRIYSQSGILVGEFAVNRRDVVPADKIPQKLVSAFIASEDDNFFNHQGIDPMGIIRAVFKNIRAGRLVQGGSTITQQVAKSFIGRQKTFTRKFKEAIIAHRLESKFSKQDILYLYLNQIYLGHGSYGVQAAALNYFQKNVWDLNLSEMATIAGLPQAPSLYDPVTKPEAALERRAYVINRMLEEGYIDAQQAEAAQQSGLNANPIIDLFRKRAPYFTEEVRRQLQQRYGTEGVYEAGLTVETTLSLDWQHIAQTVINQGLRQLDHRQGYHGPLTHLSKPEEREDFLARVHAELPETGPSTLHGPYPALVDAVRENYAQVSVGRNQGILPIFAMRWARKPDPTVHFQSPAARATDVRKVLRAGDVILVSIADPKKYLVGEPPSMRSLVPKDKTKHLFALEQIPVVQGALVAVEPRLGYTRVLIGGYNFEDSEFNRVLQACRQPGSAFKPIHYSLAIEKNEYNASKVIIDSPVVHDDPEHEQRWKPENYEKEFQGKVTVHTALTRSMNIPSIKVMEDVGVRNAIEWAKKLGITTPLRYEMGLALGSSCVKPWELIQVYSVFNLGGQKQPLHTIKKVTDRFGRVLLNNTSYADPWQSWDEKFDRAYDQLTKPMPRVVSKESNFMITNLLKGVATYGTGASAQALGKPVAGKTGTTNDSADAWFMGFTHDIVTGVWVGHDEPSNPLGRGENGSRAALPIWLRFMQKALDKRPQGDFDVPEGITFARIDPVTGLLARPDTPNSVLEAFRQDEEPKEYVPASDMAKPDQFFKVDSNF